MAKSKTGLYVGIAAVVAVIAIVTGVLIANNNKGGDNGGGDNGTTQTTGLTVADFATIDETISYGEYDGMQTLSKAIQNGEATGKVVKIDGIVSRPGTIYSIVQASEDGSKKIGTQFIIEGSEDYPKDGDRVTITGKVVEKEPLYYVIKTIPEMIVVK